MRHITAKSLLDMGLADSRIQAVGGQHGALELALRLLRSPVLLPASTNGCSLCQQQPIPVPIYVLRRP